MTIKEKKDLVGKSIKDMGKPSGANSHEM